MGSKPKTKPRARKPKATAAPVKPPSPAAIWLATHGTFEHVEKLHESAHDALSLLLSMERMSAVRLPFRGYNEAIAALRKALL